MQQLLFIRNHIVYKKNNTMNLQPEEPPLELAKEHVKCSISDLNDVTFTVLKKFNLDSPDNLGYNWQ